jgi:hypothetical protein
MRCGPPTSAECGQARQSENLSSAICRARKAVSEALDAIGEPGTSCVYHVVGLEETVKERALKQGWNGRSVSPEAASGILTGSLGSLARHYRLTTDKTPQVAALAD